MRLLYVLSLILAVISASCSESVDHTINDVGDGGRNSKPDDVVWDVLDNCVGGEVKSLSTCLKIKVLKHFDYDVSRIASPRSLSDKSSEEKIDRLVVKRFQRYLKSREFRIQLPEFFFQGATLVFDPKKSLSDFEVEFPKSPENEDRSMSAARDMMQQKALLPLLLMLKMKLKMITPIMLTFVSIKATKALLMSKLALFMVSLFMFSQVMKKLGMHLPMLHPPPPPMDMVPFSMTTPPSYGPPPAPAYGAPSPPSASYGSPSQSASYSEGNAWEPSSSSSNSYSKVWDPQQIAYSAYYKPSGSSSSLTSSSSSTSSS